MSDRIKELEAKTKIRQSSMNKLKEISIRMSDIQDILRDIERDISLYEDTLQRLRTKVTNIETAAQNTAASTGGLLEHEEDKLRDTRSLYLDESVKTLDTAIRRVIGLGGENQMEKLESLVERLIANQEESIDQKSTESTSLEMNAAIRY